LAVRLRMFYRLNVVSAAALRLLRIVLIATGTLLFVVTFTPLVIWAARPLTSSWTNVDQGVLIILSGSTVTLPGPPPNLVIGQNTYWRVVHGIHLWRNRHFRNILVSGYGTVETIKPLLIANGIPENAILVENRSITTHENALFSKPILAGLPGPYVLLTSDYHMYRAARCFAHEDIAVETIPAPDLFKRYNTRLERWNLFWNLVDEFSAIGYYRFRGWM
jgi:uncharacterized SAM-binding protein YcdF (DUF218 family)